MTRRSATAATKPLMSPPRADDWPPTCTQCANEAEGYPGWRGEPNNEQSPYLACYGDPARHIRERTPA